MAADPQAVAMDIFGKDYITDTTFDPTQLSKNENFGIVPSNTTLTVTYKTTNPTNSNIASYGLNAISSLSLEFTDKQNLSEAKIATLRGSIEVTNEEPILGDVSAPSTSEIKRRIFDTFPTQDRAVTKADYENVAYRLPSKYGSIKRCSVQKDPDSLKRNLNMYIISENSLGKLAQSNNTIKKNLKTWINHYRMMNDTVDILDAYILNLGIDFIVRPTTGVDRYTLLDSCISQLADHFSDGFYIGEPIYISDIYTELKKVTGVLDVSAVKLTIKTGGDYAQTSIDINSNLSPDGSYLVVPENVVVEIKYPPVDIRGKVR